jgi:hypothetical protein
MFKEMFDGQRDVRWSKRFWKAKEKLNVQRKSYLADLVHSAPRNGRIQEEPPELLGCCFVTRRRSAGIPEVGQIGREVTQDCFCG